MYVQQTPTFNLGAAAKRDQKKDYENIDVTKEWPPAPEESLDDTQWKALQEMITKRLAIIQGPPGTGKTYVSKVAVQILQANRKPGDPPMIISAQTNHALDQLLGHVARFEPNYIRLGGRSTNPEVKKRALFEIRQKERIRPIPGGLFGKSSSLLTKQSKAMSAILEPLTNPGLDPFSTDQVSGPETLQRLGVLNAQQAKSLEDGASQWVSTTVSTGGPLQLWLDRALIHFEVKYALDNYGFNEVEDNDLEFEQLRENEDVAGVNDEEDIEMLKGPWISFKERFTVAPASSSDTTKANKMLDMVTDMWNVPDYLRGPMYSVIQSRAKAAMLAKFREAAVIYERLCKENLVGKWEQDAVYLRRAPIIGMTTTGLSKYRPLVSALKPKIILIEEAAEVLEAPVTVACMETLEHLILVGDHQQLQGHCSIRELEGEPFNLNVSLFERLVRNKMPYTALLRQRRMDPEFRRLLTDLYPNLSDHPSVMDRPVEPWGMGSIKSFFFDHQWSEYKDDSLSTYNEEEARFIAGFYRHLNKNGIGPEQITVLTFYNGQRKRLLKALREYPDITTGYLQVKTVDSYQGEENDIVILSLVRSHEDGKIGFVSNIHRVCVALSRAKFGLYLFGNSRALMSGSELWYNVINRMASGPKRVDTVLPVQCKNHGTTTLMQYPEDWHNTEGGCTKPCNAPLACLHVCPLPCHPYSHEKVQCTHDCTKTLPCGHGCGRKCPEACFCPCERFAQFRSLIGSLEVGSAPGPRGSRQQGLQDVRGAPGLNGQFVPNHGGASYLQAQSRTSRNTGPSYRDGDPRQPSAKRSSPLPKYPKRPNTIKTGHTGGRAWNPTPGETILSHHLSPAYQLERREGWRSFAQGGVKADDERRGRLVPSQSMPTRPGENDGLPMKTSPSLAPQASASLQNQTKMDGIKPPVAKESVTVMDDGRSRFTQEYRPEASRGGELLAAESQENHGVRQFKWLSLRPTLHGVIAGSLSNGDKAKNGLGLFGGLHDMLTATQDRASSQKDGKSSTEETLGDLIEW